MTRRPAPRVSDTQGRAPRPSEATMARRPGRAGVPQPRIGLVLGAGGVLGAAWMAGALVALQERLPIPIGEAELIVGTSAGSVVAAALRCGVGVEEIAQHQR